MAGQAVFGITSTEMEASRVANALRAEGFSESDISVLFPDKSGPRDVAHEKNSKAPEGAAAGSAGWSASARWQFRALARSLPLARSSRRLVAQRLARRSVV